MDDPKVKELLLMTDYGNYIHWESRFEEWAQKNCYTSADFNYASELVKMIISKSNDVGEYLDSEMRKPTPIEHYIYELKPLAHLDSHWPRI